MKRHTFEGNDFCYTDQGSGPPMVFMHNGGNDHTIWKHQAPEFAGDHRVLCLDLPGYGASGRPKLDYSLDYYTRAIGDFLEKVIKEPAILAGNCMGSAIALDLAAKNPERVKALILFNVLTKKTLLAGQYGPVSRLAACPLAGGLMVGISERMTPPRFVARKSIMGQFGSGYIPEESFVEHLSGLYQIPGQLRVLQSLVAHMDMLGAADGLNKPQGFAPTMVLWGEKNRILPWKAGKAFCETFGPDKTLLLKNGGHLCMVEFGDRSNREIREFLNSL